MKKCIFNVYIVMKGWRHKVHNIKVLILLLFNLFKYTVHSRSFVHSLLIYIILKKKKKNLFRHKNIAFLYFYQF